MNVEIGPSLLAADPLNLESGLKSIGSANFVHVDIFDDQFVRGCSWGTNTVTHVASASPVEVDLHLMVEDPKWWVSQLVCAGVDRVFFHLETTDDHLGVAEVLLDAGVTPGIAISPGTPLERVLEAVDAVDQLLIMTVEPGYGGSEMLGTSPDRVREAAESFPSMTITADGGVTPENISDLYRAGARRFVAGTSVFGWPDPAERIRALRDGALRGRTPNLAWS